MRPRRARPDRHHRRAPRRRAVRPPSPPLRAASRPRPRGAVRDRRRPGRARWGTDGQERHRLRHAPAPGRLLRDARDPDPSHPALSAPPQCIRWFGTDLDPAAVQARCFQPSTIFWHPDAGSQVLLEGHPDDVDAQARAASLDPLDDAPTLPAGPHRGRISVAPDRISQLGHELDSIGEVTWIAEWGVGTVHVAAPTEAALGAPPRRGPRRAGLAAPNRRRGRPRRIRDRASQRGAHGPDQGGVRPGSQARPGTAADPSTRTRGFVNRPDPPASGPTTGPAAPTVAVPPSRSQPRIDRA